MGSVVTIPPDTIINDGEGLTQTSIHELGHASSFRHPHDYRYNQNLYKYWCWDISVTPLSYLHSIYNFNEAERNVVFRGQYRYLFNISSNLIATIKSTLITKNFSPEYYPTEIYSSLTNVSTMVSESLEEFLLHNYTNALKSFIEINNHLNVIYLNTTNLPDYFIPLINFDNINKSEIDYGDNIKVSGSVVSFELPSIEIPTLFKNYSPIIETTTHEDFLYESTFTSIISSTLLDTDDNELIILIHLFDGVMNYFYTIRFILFQIRASIISPFNNMHLDLTYSSTLRVSGKYYSVSNNSKLKTLYGSYWYVEDHDNENSTYWIDINKTSGDDWEFQANISYFNNGDNLIKVSIYNTDSSFTDTIRLTIFGLPESYQTNKHINTILNTNYKLNITIIIS